MTVRIVVADDAEGLRSLLVRALQKTGDIEVVGEAANGREALDLTAALAPQVLLLDLSMPVLDGMAVLRELAGSVPVVVLTGYGEDDIGPECRALGARGFVEKGAPVQSIRDAIIEALA
jgi:DNA-binding NarL/FixJ family response regulator